MLVPSPITVSWQYDCAILQSIITRSEGGFSIYSKRRKCTFPTATSLNMRWALFPLLDATIGQTYQHNTLSALLKKEVRTGCVCHILDTLNRLYGFYKRLGLSN